MDAAHDNRRQLGQLMVDEGFLTEEQLAQALDEQRRTGRPLGSILVELGFVSAGAVGNALAEQHGGLLKTEFGISAGLHVLPGGAASPDPAPSPAPAPAPVAAAPAPPPPAAPAPAAPVAPPVPAPPAAPAPDPAAARMRELESQLRTILTERNAFAQKLNELQPRLAQAAQAQATEVARVTAAAAAHIDGLEAQLQTAQAAREQLEAELKAAQAAREELEAKVQPAQAGREQLEAELTAACAAREELEQAARLATTRIAELEQDVALLRAEAEQRSDELAAAVPPPETAHVLFIPSPGGYRLLERPGPAPASGTLLDVDGLSFAVGRVGASPLPGSRLRCAFLARL